jgi:hypothetical protein
MERQRCLPLQDDETSETRRPCTEIFMKTMGLPCGHLLQRREAANQAIQIVIYTGIGMSTVSQSVMMARLSIALFLILNLAVESLVEQLARDES